MRYFAINLGSLVKYCFSGKSVNKEPMRHTRRVLADFEMFFVEDGELWMKQDSVYGVKKGEVLFHAKGEEQCGTRLNSNSFYWFHFDGEVKICETEEQARQVCQKGEKWIFFAEKFALQNTDRITIMLTELNHYRFEGNSELVKDHLSSALLAELARQYLLFSPFVVHTRISQVVGWLYKHITEDISVVSIAERFSYNPKYFTALFKKYTGRTVKEWIIEKRISFSKRLLTNSTDSIKQIAHTVGFSDEYYFMRVFKQATGMTPKSYRKTFCACLYS
ncbi:MAG: helix-turn-helix transcriptional regulator [Clostridia bacterium]|nr:helix-turn-helix transcriptional regulator [Clostridia bacterium]